MRKNFWLKMASVVISIALWVFVITRGQTEISMQAPLVVENLPDGIVLSAERPGAVALEIRGHERFIRGLREGDVVVMLDAGTIKTGRNRLEIKEDDVRLPAPLTLVSINPSTVTVFAFESAEKTVPVRPRLEGAPKQGFVMNSVSVDPEVVSLVGPRSEVRLVEAVNTEPIRVYSRTSGFESEVRLETPSANITMSEQTVKLKVIITEAGQGAK